MDILDSVVIVGAGGLGREVFRMLENSGTKVIGFVDNMPAGKVIIKGKNGIEYRILGDDNWMLDKAFRYVIAIGDPFVRKKIYDKLAKTANRLYNFCKFPAYLGGDILIGEGTIICPGAVITEHVRIGKCCIINVNCSIGHDVEMGDFVSVHPLCSISGHMKIEDCCEIGNGTSTIPSVTIHKDSLIGAGSVITRDIPENSVAYGVPAKRKRARIV